MSPNPHQFLLRWYAKKYHRMYYRVVSMEELYQDVYEIYMECFSSYDSSKGASFLTWLDINIKGRLYRKYNQGDLYFEHYEDHINKEADRFADAYEYKYMSSSRSPEKEYLFMESLTMLSEEAQKIVSFVLGDIEELGIAPSSSSKKIRGAIKRYFNKTMGLSHDKTNKAFREIKQLVNEL